MVRNPTVIPMLSRTGGIQPRGDRGIAAFGRGIVSGCCITTLKKISKGLNFHKLRLFATAVYPFSRDGIYAFQNYEYDEETYHDSGSPFLGHVADGGGEGSAEC